MCHYFAITIRKPFDRHSSGAPPRRSSGGGSGEENDVPWLLSFCPAAPSGSDVLRDGRFIINGPFAVFPCHALIGPTKAQGFLPALRARWVRFYFFQAGVVRVAGLFHLGLRRRHHRRLRPWS